MYTHDVIILGSGPAGASAAYALASRGMKVCILEKERLPRYKTCGGGVQVKAANLLPFSIDPVVERTVYGMQIGFGLKEPFLRYYEEPLIYMTMREQLDYHLTQQAVRMGAELRDGIEVQSLSQDEDSVMAFWESERLKARFLIGADGSKGITARTFGLMEGVRRIPAVEAEVDIAFSDGETPLDCARIDWGTIREGYAWTFPKAKVLSIGAGTHPGGKPKAYYEQYQRISLHHPNPFVHRLTGHPIPYRLPNMPVHCGRVLLAGDAAGLADPFSGEGIFYAIRSGQLAASVLYEEAGRRLPELERYTAAVEEALTPELEAGALLGVIFRMAGRQIHTALHYSDRVWTAFCRVMRGERTYSSLIKRMENPPPLMQFFSVALRKARPAGSFPSQNH